VGDVRVGQVVGGPAEGVGRQLAEVQLGEDDPGNVDGVGGVGHRPAEVVRVQLADHHGGDGAELLVEVQAGARLGGVLGALEFERAAVGGDQVEVPEGGHRDPGEHLVDREVQRALGRTVGLDDEALVHETEGELVRPVVRVQFEEHRLAPHVGLHAHRVVAAEGLRFEHRGDECLGDEGQVQVLCHVSPLRSPVSGRFRLWTVVSLARVRSGVGGTFARRDAQAVCTTRCGNGISIPASSNRRFSRLTN